MFGSATAGADFDAFFLWDESEESVDPLTLTPAQGEETFRSPRHQKNFQQ